MKYSGNIVIEIGVMMFNKKEYNKKYRKENKEYLSAKRRENYKKNKNTELKKNKEWKENNKEYLKEYNKNYRNRNREYRLKSMRQWREKNKKKILEYSKGYREINPKKIKRNIKRWRVMNKEYILRYRRMWSKTEKGKAAKQRDYSRRRNGIGGVINNLTADEWIEILKEYKFRCAYCGKEFNLFDKATKDHVIPISKGGDNTKENIVPACKSCNSKKHNKMNWRGDIK